MICGDVKFCRIGLELSKLDVDRTRDMTLGKCLLASYIDEDGCSVIKGSFCIFDSYTFDLVFSEWYFACLGGGMQGCC